jgi:uncharacterized membrane protein YeiH
MYHIRNTVAVLERIAFAAGNCIEIDEYKSVMKSTSDAVLYAVDLAGTFVFAVEGASAAAHGNLDVLGMMVLAFATAVGGGTVRDVLLAQVPVVLRSDVYATAAMAGSAVMVLGLRLRMSSSAIDGALDVWRTLQRAAANFSSPYLCSSECVWDTMSKK